MTLASQQGALHGQLASLFKTAVAKVVASGRTPLVELGATWCGPCRALEQALRDSSDMIDAFAGTTVIHLDTDDWPREERLPLGLVSNNRGIPALLAVDARGKVIQQANLPDDFAAWAAAIKRFVQALISAPDTRNQHLDRGGLHGSVASVHASKPTYHRLAPVHP